MKSEPSPTKPDPGLMTAVRYVAGSAAVLVLVTGLAAGTREAIGTALGGLLATANLLLFVRLGRAFLAQEGRGSPWVALAVIKLLGLFAAMFILLRHTDFSALFLLVGYGALPIGVVLAGVLGPRPPDDGELSPPDNPRDPP